MLVRELYECNRDECQCDATNLFIFGIDQVGDIVSSSGPNGTRCPQMQVRDSALPDCIFNNPDDARNEKVELVPVENVEFAGNPEPCAPRCG